MVSLWAIDSMQHSNAHEIKHIINIFLFAPDSQPHVPLGAHIKDDSDDTDDTKWLFHDIAMVNLASNLVQAVVDDDAHKADDARKAHDVDDDDDWTGWPGFLEDFEDADRLA